MPSSETHRTRSGLPLPHAAGVPDDRSRRLALGQGVRMTAGLVCGGWAASAAAGADSRSPLQTLTPPVPMDRASQGPSMRQSGDTAPAPLRLALAWRGPSVGDVQHAGILEVPDDGPQLRIAAALALPGRAHGLTPLADGGFLVVAFRPGQWLLRLDARARPVARTEGLGGQPDLHYSGHAVVDEGSGRVWATVSERGSAKGLLAVHALSDLRLQALLPTGGIEPHELVVESPGRLLVAHGGIRRNADGRRLPGAPVEASLDRLDWTTGERLDRWTLDDPDVSIRHLDLESGSPYGSADPDPVVALALQGEHARGSDRDAAPFFARRKGGIVQLLDASTGQGGVAGDVVGVPWGGAVLSQSAGGHAWWARPEPAEPRSDRPAQIRALEGIARLRESGALAVVRDTPGLDDTARAGVWIAAGRGLARWHPEHPPRLLAWPSPLAPDNHMAVLVAA